VRLAPLLRVRDGFLQRASRREAEAATSAREANTSLACLSLALAAADDVLGGDDDVLEQHLGGVREADAVLDLVAPRRQPGRVALDDEERRPSGAFARIV